MLRRSLSGEAEAISSCPEGGEVEVIGRGRVRLANGLEPGGRSTARARRG
jgi:hypothetical protein